MESNYSQTTSGSRFSVQEDLGGSIARLCLIGELDLSTVPLLEERLNRIEENGNVAIIMDLHRLEFTDCKGLSALLAAQKRASARCDYLLLLNARPEVRRLFSLTGHSRLLSPPRIPPPSFVNPASFVAEGSHAGNGNGTRDRILS